jgi:hypothetical protein
MKRFAISAVLATAAAIGSAATADAQYVYGYNAVNPYTGGVVSSGTVATPFGSQTSYQAYNPYTGGIVTRGAISTPFGTQAASSYYNAYTGATGQRYLYTNPYGTNLYNSYGVNPYLGTGHASGYYTPGFGVSPYAGYRFRYRY